MRPHGRPRKTAGKKHWAEFWPSSNVYQPLTNVHYQPLVSIISGCKQLSWTSLWTIVNYHHEHVSTLLPIQNQPWTNHNFHQLNLRLRRLRWDKSNQISHIRFVDQNIDALRGRCSGHVQMGGRWLLSNGSGACGVCAFPVYGIVVRHVYQTTTSRP